MSSSSSYRRRRHIVIVVVSSSSLTLEGCRCGVREREGVRVSESKLEGPTVVVLSSLMSGGWGKAGRVVDVVVVVSSLSSYRRRRRDVAVVSSMSYHVVTVVGRPR